MATVKLIQVKEDILADNSQAATSLRGDLRRKGVFLLNLMAAPGAGKTSLIRETAAQLSKDLRLAVMEADIDSTVDAEALIQSGVHAIQLHTGGLCHLDAAMVRQGLAELDLSAWDAVILENVGNLVCPAEFDTGAVKSVAILSVPEGDDKPLKYPLMFQTVDAVVVNKTDYLSLAAFDLIAFGDRVRRLNPMVPIFEVSCRTGDGLKPWMDWFQSAVREWIRG
ncbi:MAG: hydrogenase nickel incorporation protein HypB [Myxococcota bacterium]|nr:hydrogenase nickel incorporation protein HypB [Myxococcota bacterium]